MRYAQLTLILRELSEQFKKEKAKRQFKKRSGITPKRQDRIWMEEAIDDVSAGFAARQVLNNQTALRELAGLIADDWFFLDWVLPEDEIGRTPKDRVDYAVALQTTEYSPPYPFIGRRPFVYLKPRYRTPSDYDTFIVEPVDVIINFGLQLRLSDTKTDGMAWHIARLLQHVRANEPYT